MTIYEQRLIELRFYLTLREIFKIKPNVHYLATMLDCLHYIVPFDMDKVIEYANRFNLDITWKPYAGEICGMLNKYDDVPISVLACALQISRKTVYGLVHAYNRDPPLPIPKVPKTDLKHLQAVYDAFNLLKKGLSSHETN